jgi:hypothetical protein
LDLDTNALQEHGQTLHRIDVIFWRLLQVPKNIKVIKKVFPTSDLTEVLIICVDNYTIALLRFRLSDEVGLMLTFPFIFSLLVKVNEVFGVRHLRDQCPFAPHL